MRACGGNAMIRKKLAIFEASSPEFSRYGARVYASSKAPDAACPEFRWWANQGWPEMGGVPSVGLVESTGKDRHESRIFERHAATSETLIPVDADVVLVVARSASLSGTEIDPESVRAFRVRRGEAVILHSGTWHYAPLTCAPRARTFVVFDRRTPDGDVLKIDSEVDLGVTFAINLTEMAVT